MPTDTTRSEREQLHGGDPVEVAEHRHATTWLWERESVGDPTHVVRYPVDAEGEQWSGMDVGQLASRVRSIAAGLISMGRSIRSKRPRGHPPASPPASSWARIEAAFE